MILIKTALINHHNSNHDEFEAKSKTSLDILNSFNHLVLCHDNDFEKIYGSFDKCCEFRECKSFKRHRRNRSEIALTENENVLNELYANSKDIINAQIMDKIHCYYLHAFDIGFTITSREK